MDLLILKYILILSLDLQQPYIYIYNRTHKDHLINRVIFKGLVIRGTIYSCASF